MVVKTRVREVDLHKVTIGQECDVTVEAYPNKKIKGSIAFIGALASESSERAQGAKYFQMTVTLISADSELRPGMTSRISILAGKVDNAVTLPVYTIFEDRNGRYCFNFQNGKYKRVLVETGRENEDLTEIVSGLQEGDWVSTIKPESGKGF